MDASFSKDTLLIGDQVEFTFTVDQPEGLRVNIPLFSDSLPGGPEILELPRIDTALREGRLHITHRYRVTSFDTLPVVVPPLEISYKKDSLNVRLATPPLNLVVKPMPVDTTTVIADIKGPVKAPLTLAELWPYLLGLLLIVIAVYFLRRYLIGRKQKAVVKPSVAIPDEPADVIALRELNRLREEKVWQQGRVKEYYSRLSNILRLYLEHRYALPAMERTTFEILQSLKHSGFNDRKLFEILKDILETSDLVKFAKYTPLPEKNETVLLNAVVFVNGTRPAWKKEEDLKDGEPREALIEEGGQDDHPEEGKEGVNHD